MKRINLTLLFIFIINIFYCQREFKAYENGLIYNESTMNQLKLIVDSLNLKYKACDLDKVYYSKPQTIGHVVKLDNCDPKLVKKDMDNDISYEMFIEKYPEAIVKKNVLIVKFNYKNFKDEEIIEVSEISLTGNYGFEIKQNKEEYLDLNLKRHWLYKNKIHSNNSFAAFFFLDDFQQIPLNKDYSRQIGYSDCLIDTSMAKFKSDAESGRIRMPPNWKDLTIKEKENLLEKMRSTRVIGSCSMDNSPRDQAVNIVLLSAETVNWGVFLKSHLDIMNDRFDRMSDGSYAWGQRETYIKELEELDINVIDLLIGISLRVENSAQNHYNG